MNAFTEKEKRGKEGHDVLMRKPLQLGTSLQAGFGQLAPLITLSHSSFLWGSVLECQLFSPALHFSFFIIFFKYFCMIVKYHLI